EDDHAREPARLSAGPRARGRRPARDHREGATLGRPHDRDQAVTRSFDLIVVGSGLAGLYAALLAARSGDVLLLSKSEIRDCNTAHAQGGIAAALLPPDSPELHFRDTLVAGDGLCDRQAVRVLVEEGPR